MRWRAGVTVCLAAVVCACALAGPGAAGAASVPSQPTEVEPHDGYSGPLTLGPEGALWFASGTKLGRIGSDGTLTETTLSQGVGSLADIAAGREGNLWATEGHELDRITPAGEVTRFPLPKSNERPGQLAVAEDGALWFSVWASGNRNEGQVGKAYVIRMNPDGAMTRLPLPGSAKLRDAAATSIVAGPGGEIWFADPAFGRVGRVTPAGDLTEFPVRLQPEVLVPDGADRLWFIGAGGVGTIDAAGKSQEIRTGNFLGLPIGSDRGAVVGPEGALWFIGGATRVMQLTPFGQLSVVRGPGAPAASRIALGPGGSIWVSTESDPVKFVSAAPLLRYEPGFPAIEIRSAIVTVRGGRTRVELSCGGSAGGCSGAVRLALGRNSAAPTAYSLASESEGAVALAVPGSERRLLAANGYSRVPVEVSVEGGNESFAEIVLRAPHPRGPRPGRPLVMPLPEGIEVRGLAPGPDGAVWTGGDIGRFNRVTLGGRASTVALPGLIARAVPFGSDSRHDLWFSEFSDGVDRRLEAEPVVGRLAPGGKLTQVRLPRGPRLEGAAVSPTGEVWVARADYPHRGEVDRLDPSGTVSRFPVGVEPGAIVAGPDGGAWFTESGPRVAHISATGEVRAVRLPHKGFVDGLTLGRHGAVWFTHGSRRYMPPAIGRLDKNGKVTEFPLRHHGSPGSILAAPDGDIWFTTDFPSRVGRMTPRGKVKIYRRGGAAAGAIALGPEGDLWFAAIDQDTVAVFRP